VEVRECDADVDRLVQQCPLDITVRNRAAKANLECLQLHSSNMFEGGYGKAIQYQVAWKWCFKRWGQCQASFGLDRKNDMSIGNSSSMTVRSLCTLET
jgi:hypothetical protein